MFSSDVDHSQYLLANLDDVCERSGFPYSRFKGLESNPEDEPTEDSEQLIMALHGDMAEILILTTKKVAVYKIPRPKSFIKKAFSVAVDNIPVVSDVLDGVDGVKSFTGGASNLKGWVTGKNKRLAKEREAAGMPSKKDFKDVTWNLKKPDGLALALSYRDDILMANGFGWKVKFQNNHLEDQPTKLLLKPREVKIQSGKLKWSLYFSSKDAFSYEVIKNNSHLFTNTSELEIHGDK